MVPWASLYTKFTVVRCNCLKSETHTQKDSGLIKSTTLLYKDRKIHWSVKDLQSKTSRGSYISLTQRWISLSLYKVVVDYFSPLHFYHCGEILILLLKLLQNIFWSSNRANSTSYNCRSYDATIWLALLFCLQPGIVGDNPLETSFWILTEMHGHLCLR